MALRKKLAALGVLGGYQRAAAVTAPGRHQVWPHASERRVGASRLLGRLQETIALVHATTEVAEEKTSSPSIAYACA